MAVSVAAACRWYRCRARAPACVSGPPTLNLPPGSGTSIRAGRLLTWINNNWSLASSSHQQQPATVDYAYHHQSVAATVHMTCRLNTGHVDVITPALSLHPRVTAFVRRSHQPHLTSLCLPQRTHHRVTSNDGPSTNWMTSFARITTTSSPLIKPRARLYVPVSAWSYAVRR